MDGFAVEDLEATFQVRHFALAPLLGTACSDLHAEPEAAEPARQQKHDDDNFHGALMRARVGGVDRKSLEWSPSG
jgi:hypothetical protein